MKRVFALVYCLVLLVQMPHVSTVYAALERPGWYHWLGWPLALAFEASILVFTYRLVVERSTRRATRAGLAFFLVASCVANATYYELAPALFRWIMPVFGTVALPLALALFASEFGAEVRREERRVKRAENAVEAQATQTSATPRATEYECAACGRSFANRYALSAHARAHQAAHVAGGNGHHDQTTAV